MHSIRSPWFLLHGELLVAKFQPKDATDVPIDTLRVNASNRPRGTVVHHRHLVVMSSCKHYGFPWSEKAFTHDHHFVCHASRLSSENVEPVAPDFMQGDCRWQDAH